MALLGALVAACSTTSTPSARRPSVGTQESVIGRYVFAGRRLVAVRYLPVRIHGDVEPRPLDPRAGEGRAVLDRMLRSMRELAGAMPPRLDGPGIDDACP